MNNLVLQPDQWSIPDPKRVIETLNRIKQRKSQSSEKSNSSWRFTDVVSPLDFYCYLKMRFGDPNGFAMMLRSQAVDNFIHWHYTLATSDTIIDIMGLNIGMEIQSHGMQVINSGWQQLESNLNKEFDHYHCDLRKVRETFERWHLFINPYGRLSTIVQRYVTRLKELDISHMTIPKPPELDEDFVRYKSEIKQCLEVCQEAMCISVGIQMIAPVMGKAAINFLMLILAKPEVKNDGRLYQDFLRRNIDVRIKSLHLCCDGFDKAIDGSEEPFKNFLRLMNRRNDTLHGNIDPMSSTGEDIYFDHQTIPLVSKYKGLTEIALANILGNLNPEEAIQDVQVVHDFVWFLLSRLHPDIRSQIVGVFDEQQIGYCPKTKMIGSILPKAYCDLIPNHSGLRGGIWIKP